MASIFIIFDKPPGPDAPRFIEEGNSVAVGEWAELTERGYWALKLPQDR